MSHPKNVVNIVKRSTVAQTLAEIPESFFALSYTRGTNEARRLWFIESGIINWKEAACVGQNPAWWFPERGQNDILDLAMSICRGCPIKTECLAFALCTGEDEGVWGSTTGRDRRNNRRRLLKALKEIRSKAA